MLKKYNPVIIGVFICCSINNIAYASIATSSSNQTEQDKARQASLAPLQQDYTSSLEHSDKETIKFPKEENCREINDVIIDSGDDRLTHKLLGRLSAQAKGKCLGIGGIRLLALSMQNELIARGYITSLIDIAPQTLDDGILKLELNYGKVGSISYSDESKSKTRLWNSLPFSQNEILKLSNLEQGMANLQRIPGSDAKMKLMPGAEDYTSDIVLTRNLGKKWQVSGWLNDAGSRSSGRYLGGAALYLYDLTSLNDILYVSGGGDVEYKQHDDGNKNASLFYSIPFGFWTVSLYGSYSKYLQMFRGQWSTTEYESKNRYYSATLARLLSHTRQQKTSVDMRVFKSTSRYYFGGTELDVMRKQNPGWELTLNHQHYFDRKVVNASIGVQHRLPWFNSTATPEEKAGLYTKQARVIHADIQALMKFDATGDRFSWAPQFYAQISPDTLSSDNKFNIGNRWSVRGFDGERTLSSNQGWYWRNDLIWDVPDHNQQLYVGLDVGKIISSDQYQKGKVMSGAVVGLRGNKFATQYDVFVGTPLYKPDSFHTDAFNMGFNLQWKY